MVCVANADRVGFTEFFFFGGGGHLLYLSIREYANKRRDFRLSSKHIGVTITGARAPPPWSLRLYTGTAISSMDSGRLVVSGPSTCCCITCILSEFSFLVCYICVEISVIAA